MESPLNPFKVDPSTLYEQRLIVLLETGPQTNKYEQIIMNNEQFKKVTELVGSHTLTEDCGNPNCDIKGPHWSITTEDSHQYTLDSEIQSYEKK